MFVSSFASKSRMLFIVMFDIDSVENPCSSIIDTSLLNMISSKFTLLIDIVPVPDPANSITPPAFVNTDPDIVNWSIVTEACSVSPTVKTPLVSLFVTVKLLIDTLLSVTLLVLTISTAIRVSI